MSAEFAAISPERPKAYRVILWAGLIAGILDIASAFVHVGLRGQSPMYVLQSIASGLLGADSYKGGFATAALGLLLHFFIAFVATAIYYAMSRKLKLLVERPIVFGLLYGVAVYLFMYFVVLPITFSRKPSYPLASVVISLIIHILFVGLPISLAVRHFSKLQGQPA